MGTSSGFVTALLGGGLAVDSRAPWVDVRDVARAIVLALDKPAGRHYLADLGRRRAIARSRRSSTSSPACARPAFLGAA